MRSQFSIYNIVFCVISFVPFHIKLGQLVVALIHSFVRSFVQS